MKEIKKKDNESFDGLFHRFQQLCLKDKLFSEEGNDAWWGASWNIDNTVTNWSEANQLASRYEVELAPVIVNAQLGFALNY